MSKVKKPTKPLSAVDAIASAMAVESALEKRRSVARESGLKAQIAALGDQLEAERARADMVDGLRDLTREIKIESSVRAGRVLNPDRRIATAVAIASDWHWFEDVDPKKVNGLNEYNPAIAHRRAERFFAGIEWLISQQARIFDVRHLVLGLIGDLITGYLRDEDLESNHGSPTEEVVDLVVVLETGLRFLHKALPELTIHIPCLSGNHGRTTHKLRVATASRNSFEWLMYRWLASRFKDEKWVTFQIADGHHTLVDIYGLRMHLHHGDSVRSNGGIGGVDVPLGRAVAGWRLKFRSHLSVCGHFHQFQAGERLVRNGSLIGYGAYSDWLPGADPEPAQQAFFLIDSKRGKTNNCPIWCQD